MGASRPDGRDVPESGRIMLTLSFVEFDPKQSFPVLIRLHRQRGSGRKAGSQDRVILLLAC